MTIKKNIIEEYFVPAMRYHYYDLVVNFNAEEEPLYKFIPNDVKVLAFSHNAKTTGVLPLPENINLFFGSFLSSKILSVGLCPINRTQSFLIDYFNRFADLSYTVALFAPTMFKKKSLQNKLNNKFFLVLEKDIDKYSFYDNIPRSFQIWHRKTNEETREIYKPKLLKNFRYVKKNENPDFAVKRIGKNAGQATEKIDKCKENTYYFFQKLKEIPNVIKKINDQNINLGSILGKIEINDMLNNIEEE